ncbi:hypothetical protein NMG60_11017214 [Bertholletia excelsa]
MDLPDFPGKSPRKELQGPRPTPLKINKDSHKIRKPPVAPAAAAAQPPAQHHRPPVIIYTVSPKIIHTDPSEFMDLVQRLTGPDPIPTTSSAPFADSSGAISPAARFASMEKIKSPEKKKPQIGEAAHVGEAESMDTNEGVERTGMLPGILSPDPTALPSIPQAFFSPPSDPNPLSFFHDLSPVLQGNRNYLESTFMPSPSFLSPHLTSPTLPLDLFNNLFDY